MSLEEHEAELKKKLARRMAFAAVMIAVLLGALALFDQLSGPTPTVTVTKAAAPQQQKEVTQPVKPAEPAPTVPDKEEAKPGAPEESAAPTEKGAPPPPAPAANPAESSKPAVSKAAPTLSRPQPVSPPALTMPRSAAATKPLSPTLPTQKTLTPPAQKAGHENAGNVLPTIPQVAPVTNETPQAPTRPTAPSAPQSSLYRPPQVASQPAPAVQAKPQPAPVRLFSGYTLQAGVFTNTQRAEELYAKLQLNGIPATLETRVSVGPFKTREEADAAREKMRELGIDSVMLAPRGARK